MGSEEALSPLPVCDAPAVVVELVSILVVPVVCETAEQAGSKPTRSEKMNVNNMIFTIFFMKISSIHYL
ncbi:MAG: hypothetical protein VB070_10810 [Clostridiaceae bacterium]|nr:hypothetical protein [Clostridiaceae bacterium]